MRAQLCTPEFDLSACSYFAVKSYPIGLQKNTGNIKFHSYNYLAETKLGQLRVKMLLYPICVALMNYGIQRSMEFVPEDEMK
jgi:hypothetical protein